LDTGGTLSTPSGGVDRRFSPFVIRHPITSYTAGEDEIYGMVQLSEGPAFGRTILANIQGGILLAGLVAGVVAFWFGWVISLRISRPIQNLAVVTAQMAEGDLKVRADISRRDEIGQLGRSFNHMAGQVETSMTSLRRFIADAAHEIHTPLTALRTNLELSISSTDQAAHITKSLAITGRIEKLSDDLLHLSRLESGVDEVEMVHFQLDELMRELCEMYAGQAEQADLGFDVKLAGAVSVFGNPNQLGRAIANILDNAVKFTPAGGSIEVNMETLNASVQVSVIDSGIGILEADRGRLFDRFHRGRNASEIPGSGLGLAIARAIVIQHGGEIQVTPNDPGTRFEIRLPIDDP
jgi:signal transduction histidine kinase